MVFTPRKYGMGLSALLSSTVRAMRKPSSVDWAQNWLHVFRLYVINLLLND